MPVQQNSITHLRLLLLVLTPNQNISRKHKPVPNCPKLSQTLVQHQGNRVFLDRMSGKKTFGGAEARLNIGTRMDGWMDWMERS